MASMRHWLGLPPGDPRSSDRVANDGAGPSRNGTPVSDDVAALVAERSRPIPVATEAGQPEAARSGPSLEPPIEPPGEDDDGEVPRAVRPEGEAPEPGVYPITRATDYWFNMEVHGLEKQARFEAEQWALRGLPRHDVKLDGPLPVEQALAARAVEIFRQWTARVQTKVKDAVATRTQEVRAHVATMRSQVDALRETRAMLAQTVHERDALGRGGRREPSSIGVRSMLSSAWFWLLMVLLVAVDFVANVPVFAELLPPDPLADRTYRGLADQAELYGLWAGPYRVWARIVTYPDASILAVGVIVLLVFLGDRIGVASRVLFAYREADAPGLAHGMRRHRRQSWAPLVACLLGSVAVVAVLFMSRERILDRAHARLAADSVHVATLDSAIRAAQDARDAQAVSELTLERGTVRSAMRIHEDRVTYATTIQSMNVPILFLNIALLLAAAVAGYTSHRDTISDGRGEDPRMLPVRARIDALRLEALQLRERIWSTAREADAAFTALRRLLRARPLQHWEGKAERLRRVIPIFRMENARIRSMDPASILAFREPMPIELPTLNGDLPLTAEPDDLASLEAEYGRLRLELEQIAPEADLVASREGDA